MAKRGGKRRSSSVKRNEPKFLLGQTLVKKKLENKKDDNDNPIFLTGVVKECVVKGKKQSYKIEWNNVEKSSSSSSSLSTSMSSETWKESDVEWGVLLFQSIGLKISKEFGADGTFNGEVVDLSRENESDIDPKDIIYTIFYEDGDIEEFDKSGLEDGRKLFQNTSTNRKRKKQPEPLVDEVQEGKKDENEVKHENENNGGNTGRRCRRARNKVNYKEMDDEMIDLESAEEVRKVRKQRGASKKMRPTSKKQKR
jgi:hypothetical protein